jgi:hypothetical protein
LLAALPAAQRTSRFGDFMRCLKIHEISEKLGAQGASKFFMNLFMSFDMHCLALRHLTRSKLPWRYVTICHNVPWTLCTVQCSHCALPSGLGHNHLVPQCSTFTCLT